MGTFDDAVAVSKIFINTNLAACGGVLAAAVAIVIFMKRRNSATFEQDDYEEDFEEDIDDDFEEEWDDDVYDAEGNLVTWEWQAYDYVDEVTGESVSGSYTAGTGVVAEAESNGRRLLRVSFAGAPDVTSAALGAALFGCSSWKPHSSACSTTAGSTREVSVLSSRLQHGARGRTHLRG